MDKIEFTAVNEWIHQAAADVQTSLSHMNATDFGVWLKQASEDVGFDRALSDLQHVRLEELPEAIAHYIKDNSAQTTFYVVNGIAFVSPGIIYGPILSPLGSGHAVRAGTTIEAAETYPDADCVARNARVTSAKDIRRRRAGRKLVLSTSERWCRWIRRASHEQSFTSWLVGCWSRKSLHTIWQ